MTRPMTKAQLPLMAVPIGRQRRQDSFVPFLLNVVALGAGVGIGIATLILLKSLRWPKQAANQTPIEVCL